MPDAGHYRNDLAPHLLSRGARTRRQLVDLGLWSAERDQTPVELGRVDMQRRTMSVPSGPPIRKPVPKVVAPVKVKEVVSTPAKAPPEKEAEDKPEHKDADAQRREYEARLAAMRKRIVSFLPAFVSVDFVADGLALCCTSLRPTAARLLRRLHRARQSPMRPLRRTALPPRLPVKRSLRSSEKWRRRGSENCGNARRRSPASSDKKPKLKRARKPLRRPRRKSRPPSSDARQKSGRGARRSESARRLSRPRNAAAWRSSAVWRRKHGRKGSVRRSWRREPCSLTNVDGGSSRKRC